MCGSTAQPSLGFAGSSRLQCTGACPLTGRARRIRAALGGDILQHCTVSPVTQAVMHSLHSQLLCSPHDPAPFRTGRLLAVLSGLLSCQGTVYVQGWSDLWVRGIKIRKVDMHMEE